jgi:hypothetical protein
MEVLVKEGGEGCGKEGVRGHHRVTDLGLVLPPTGVRVVKEEVVVAAAVVVENVFCLARHTQNTFYILVNTRQDTHRTHSI